MSTQKKLTKGEIWQQEIKTKPPGRSMDDCVFNAMERYALQERAEMLQGCTEPVNVHDFMKIINRTALLESQGYQFAPKNMQFNFRYQFLKRDLKEENAKVIENGLREIYLKIGRILKVGVYNSQS